MNKKLFVEKQLQKLVKAIDSSVQQLIYLKTDTQEIVEICYITGNKKVNVTADSLRAIARDVLQSI